MEIALRAPLVRHWTLKGGYCIEVCTRGVVPTGFALSSCPDHEPRARANYRCIFEIQAELGFLGVQSCCFCLSDRQQNEWLQQSLSTRFLVLCESKVLAGTRGLDQKICYGEGNKEGLGDRSPS